MRKGYRNCNNHFGIDSNIEQFGFSLLDTHLKADFLKQIKSTLAPIERVYFYLDDGTLLKNIFIVAGELVYYYEKDWYYEAEDPRAEVPSPKETIFERFEFKKEDVVLIRAENNPKPASLDFGYWIRIDWFFGVKPNRLDTKKSIEKNIFIQKCSWDILPEPSEEDLYRKTDR